MKLTHIKIENFRSIDELECDLFDLTSLIGPNNSGKSSILRAIEHYLNLSKPSADDWPKGREDQQIVITGLFEDIQDWERSVPGVSGIIQDNMIQLRVTHAHHGAKPLYEAYIQQEDIPGWANAFTKIGKELKQMVEEYGITKAADWKVGANQEKFKQHLRDNHPDMITTLDANWTSDNISIDAALKQAIPQAEIIPAVRDASDDAKPQTTTTFGKLLNAIVLPAIQTTDEYTALRTAVTNLSKKIRGAETYTQPEKIEQLAEDLSKRIADVIDVKAILDIAEPDMEKFLGANAIIRLDDGTETPISHQGHGAQRSLIFALIEAIARQKAASETGAGEDGRTRATLLLFEEPELFLHPHLMRRLKDCLKRISETHAWQVLLSTHSPFLVDVVDNPRSLAIIRKEGSGAPVAKQLKIDPFEPDSKEALRAALDFHPTVNEAFFASRVILVEGDTEMAVLRHVGMYHEHFAISKAVYDTSTVVSCGGKWTISAIAVLLDRFDIPFCIIHDCDAKGRSLEELAEAPAIDPYKANEKISAAAGAAPILVIDDTFEDLLWRRHDKTAPVPSKDKPFRAWQEIKRIVSEEIVVDDEYPDLKSFFEFAYQDK
ncbi:MAG: AAA family ATPase [Candidatus Aegiribacteria sp.]|nr:AAA family ATPase [Candidatus Aegiribacteria sp.]